MNFEELYSDKKSLNNIEVNLTGWIVLMNSQLYLIEENYKPDYKSCKKIEVNNRDIAYVLEKVVPPIAGFESFLFHKAKVSGKIISSLNLTIVPSEMYVESWDKVMEKVDISKENIERCKVDSSDLFDTTKNIGNWFDV